MGSIRTICLYSPPQFLYPKSLSSYHLSINSPFFLPVLQKEVPVHHTKVQAITKHSLSPDFHNPTSDFSVLCKCFTKFLAERLAISVIGVFIFVGSFGGFRPRPSLAIPAQVEEMRDTQMGKSEAEEDLERMYEKLLEKEPRNVDALKATVYGKMRRGQPMEAVKYVERLIKIEPDEVEWRLLEALCYDTMGQLSRAKKLFKEILKRRPLLVKALHGLAMVMHKNLEGPAVFDMLYKALEVAQREERVIEERNIKILIAQMHIVKGELEEALKQFQALVDENPRDFRPYLCQGIIYSLLNKKKEAAEQFEIYQSLVPEEFPQRGFLDDVVLSAKSTPHKHLQKEFDAEFSHRK